MATNTSIAHKYMNGMDQSTTRGVGVWFDQHKSSAYVNRVGERIFEQGRPYWSVIELKTRMPVGPVSPLGWSAPFMPPQQYIISGIGKATNVAASYAEGLPKSVTTDRIRIDYQRMKRDDNAATLDHWRLAVNLANENGWDVPAYLAPMDRRLLALVGPSPRSPKIADALLSGDPWILGQLQPTLDPATGTMRVEENEALARVLKMNREDVFQPAAWETAEVSEAPVDAKELLKEMLAMRRELDALKGEPVKNKGGRPRKDVAA